jgi:SAM-dependent methyltransferase
MFDVAAEAYDAFMGRYSIPLAPLFCDFSGVAADARALDVGCGPGALVAELSRRLGASHVAAVEPSEAFVGAVRARHPDVDVRHAPAEALPFGDGAFDASLAQLVVHFMDDPVGGLGEMARVTRREGIVAACVWDHGSGNGPLSPLWSAAVELDPEADDESGLAGAREGHLAELFAAAGMRDVEDGALWVAVTHTSFDEWWLPFTYGVGTAGSYVASLDEERRSALRDHCRASLGDGPFTVRSRAWAARGVVPD